MIKAAAWSYERTFLLIIKKHFIDTIKGYKAPSLNIP